MAMPRKIPVDFSIAFPFGAYAVGEVQQVRDYDRSTKDNLVQAVDPDSGMPIWSIDVIDGDPEARKSNRTMTVKLTAKVQPVLPSSLDGLPFTPVEFDSLTATAYIEDNGNFQKLAWSLRAGGVKEPSRGAKAAAPMKASA